MRHDRKIRECKRMREEQEEIWRSKCSKPRTAEPKIIECYTKMDPKDDTLIKGQTQKKAKMAMNAFSKLLSWVDEKSRELERLEQETQYISPTGRSRTMTRTQRHHDSKEYLEKRRVFHQVNNMLGGLAGAWARRALPDSVFAHIYRTPCNMLRTQGWAKENQRRVYYIPMPHSGKEDHLGYEAHPLVSRRCRTDVDWYPIGPVEAYYVK